MMNPFVKERFELSDRTQDFLRSLVPPFGYDGFGELIFYRTYSRTGREGNQENWHDVVSRVIEGTFSIRKDWYVRNHVAWDEQFWQDYAKKFGASLFMMKWFPPGRGLWAMGTDFVYERGAMALYNCAATRLDTVTLDYDISWLMDSLMHGVGVGFEPVRDDSMRIFKPVGTFDYEIPDSREGWCESERLLINAFIRPNQPLPRFIYDKVRPRGVPIRGFGGVASGPEPLRELHHSTIEQFEMFGTRSEYDSVYLKANLANLTGCCVVAGNVRRSAELCKGRFSDPIFIDLKNYQRFPERESYGWMSNNSVELAEDSDFDMLGEIAKRVVRNGEPGYINRINMRKGRIGKNDNLREDAASLFNPCQPASATVLTQDGICRFMDLEEGDRIWTECGWSTVLKMWSTGIKPVYRYTTTAGVFYGTANHRIVSEGFKVEVGQAVSIDVLRGPDRDNTFCHNCDIVMDGLVIGDGTDHHGTILLNIGEDDGDIFKEMGTLIRSQYNKEYQYKVYTSISELPRTFDREIPEEYFTGSFDEVCSFLRGLYSANGSVVADRVQLRATSRKLIEQVQIMLSSVGIKSYVVTDKEKEVVFDNGKYVCRQSFNLTITTDRDKFAILIGFIQDYKNQKLAEVMLSKQEELRGRNSKDTFDIISVEYLGEEEVFDITVDNQFHTYWTGCLNVSNCGEIPLENKEVCNVAETLPTMCDDVEEWYDACRHAAFYCSTVSLLPTHSQDTNRIVARNRRIGVSIIDVSGWKLVQGVHKITKWLRRGYKVVRETNNWANDEAGVPRSIRVTTIKPGGTTPKLPGRTPGIGHPTFDYTLRRILVSKIAPVFQRLVEAEIPWEDCVTGADTACFEYPIHQGPARPAEQVSVWEQAMNLILVQREWADNAVSNTLYFKPRWPIVECIEEDFEDRLSEYIGTVEARQIISNKIREYTIPKKYKVTLKATAAGEVYEINVHEYDEGHEEHDVEAVLSAIAPHTKSVSLLPHCAKGAYKQMPEEGISEEEYRQRLAKIKPIDWTEFSGSDGIDDKFCSGAACEMVRN